MAIEKQININVDVKGSNKAQGDVEKLNSKVKELNATNREGAKDSKNFGNSILENGGAMGLLNDATGGLAMTVKDAVEATSLFSKEGKIMTTVNKALTWGQNMWNAAMAANPIGLLVAAIAAVIAAGYLLIKFFMDSAAANEAAMAATKKHTKELENQTAKATQSSEALKVKNAQLYAMAKASGASAEELRKLALQYANEEIAINRSNAVIASNTFIRERNTLAVLKAKGVSDEAIAAQEKLTNATYKDLQNANKILQGSYDKKRDIINAAEVEILQAKTDASKKANEDAAKKREEDAAARKKANEDHIKEIQDFAKILRDEQIKNGYQAQDDVNAAAKANADALLTTQELALKNENDAYQLKYDNAVANGLSTEELEIEHLNKMNEINLAAQDVDYNNKKSAADKEVELAKRVAAQKQALQDAQINVASGAVGLLSALAGKNKALQKAAIIAENAIGIGKMFINTSASNVAATAEGVALSIPTAGASVAAAAALVTSNNIMLGVNVATSLMATQKALSALGGGGGAGGGGQTTGKGPTAPSFNLVKGTGSNQIAEGLATERQPVQAYVVASQVTTAQSLQRNIINNASL